MKAVIGKTLSGLLALSSVAASAAEVKLDCHSLGGGYVTQAVRVVANESGDLQFSLQRFSNLEELKDLGLEVDDERVKQMTFTVPKQNCFEKVALPGQVTLLACSTGISRIDADVELLNGTLKKLRMGDNNFFEVALTTTETVSQTKKTVGLKYTLGNLSPQSSELGFHLRECRRLK